MMRWFGKKAPAPAGAAVAAVQTCRGRGPWEAGLPRPLRPPEAAVYEELREAVPILDAAIQKIVRLSGGFRLEHPDPRAQGLLEGFRRRVPWGRSAVGLDSFLAGYLDCLLTYGSAVGEMVLSPGGREVAALYRRRPQLDVGPRPDVLDACPKALGIPMVLRAMNPQVIAVDEITAEADIAAAVQAAGCGVRLLATAHAAGVEELEQRPLYRRLLDEGVFRLAVRIARTGPERRYDVEALP